MDLDRLATGQPRAEFLYVGLLFALFALPPAIFGGLIFYTLFSTLIPGFSFRLPTPEDTTPHLVTGGAAPREDADERSAP